MLIGLWALVEVHHTKPVAELQDAEIDIEVDLIPLCPNCHSMAHRWSGELVDISELRNRVRKIR